jgi:ATP-binding cassette subfamily F protein 3
MIVLTVTDLWRQFDVEPVLRGVEFDVRPGDRIGLIGPNGVGKTTLLRILAGLDEPDRGRVELHAGARVALLEQAPKLDSGRSVFEEARSGLARLLELQREAVGVAEAIAQADDDAQRRRLERRYDRLQHELHRLDGYTVDHRVEEVLEGLGFAPAEYDQSAATLSGGQQTRLMLARLLLEAPDLLLLDEPSSHLDFEATDWLEQYLTRQRQAVLLVSHDRYFLDKVTQRTFELFNGRIEQYAGNFSAYWQQRQERLEVQRKTYEKQQEYIATQEEFIRRYHYGQRHAQAKDRQRKIDRIERVEKPREIEAPAMAFAAPRRSGDVVLDARGVSKGFERCLFDGVDLQLERGCRMGILGANGSGKTTLVRVLLGELEPDTGSVRRGANVQVGYYDQQLTRLPDDRTVLEAVWPDGHADVTQQKMRGVLARFGLTDDVVDQPVGSLSGGEKSRLALARLAAGGTNVLVLDEPTNHLDLWARGALEEALCRFEGTVLFVSHDRYFLNRVADRLLVLEPGRVRLVEGNYDTYRHMAATLWRDEAVQADTTAVEAEKAGRDRRRAARPAKPRRRFPYRKVEELEREIAAQEESLRQLDKALADVQTYQDPDRAEAVRQEYAQARQELERLYEHWEEAMELN